MVVDLCGGLDCLEEVDDLLGRAIADDPDVLVIATSDDKMRLRESFDSIDADYQLDIEVSGESFLTPPGDFSKLVESAVSGVTGKTPTLNTSGGTSDARFIRHFCPVAEFGLVGATMHKTDESVALEDLEALTEIYLRVLDGFFPAS